MSKTPNTRDRDVIAEADPRVLLSWYDANRRALPWRRNTDPYRVLVSEVMLQQTRAEVVERRFEEFLARFPTLASLAQAETDEVLAAWSGLGYYRRARNLHASARRIWRDRTWPSTADQLRQLPGIGDYTAAAVASIAFGQAVIALDGNVKRLAARRTADAGDPSKAATLRRLKREAERWLDPRRPGDSNQALMELGATVCRPQPRCFACPLRGSCRGYSAGEPRAFPGTRSKQAAVRRHWRLALIQQRGRVWLARRAGSEMWLPGLFELPWVDNCDDGGAEPEQRISDKYGLPIRFRELQGHVRHTIGRRAIRAEVWRADLNAGDGSVADTVATEGRWVEPDRLDELATTSLVRKALVAAGCRSTG